MAKSVVVIGAGIGGLAAAARLAQAGCDVTVLEKNAQVGGQLCDHQAAGFRWSIGPPALCARPLLETLFHDLGRELKDSLRLLPLDPQTRYFFPDGATFDTRRDWSATASEIAKINPEDVSGYLRYLAHAARIHRLRQYGFGRNAPANQSAASGSLLRSWLRARPFASAYSAVSRQIRSDKLRRVLAHHASQSGGSPFSVSAVYGELAHAVLNSGLWHPRDGMTAIARALERLAAESAVNIRLGCPAARIEIERDKAIGVALASGEILRADAVVSNADPIVTARSLLPAAVISATRLRSLAQKPMSSSAFFLLLGIRGTFPQLAHHNIFFSDDGRAEIEQLYRRGLMPDDPTITLTISSKTDPPNAPGNQENWLIRVKAPPLSEKVNWAMQTMVARDRILTILEQRYSLGLRDRIRSETYLTPAHLQQLSGAWRGALHGESPQGRRAALARPQIRSPHVQHLYQVGGAVLPGGGLPQALLSAKAAADLLIQDLG